MAPHNSDNRILGLHMLRVLGEARKLVAKLAGGGGARRVAGGGIMNPELEDLETAVNALCQFEREASVRGTVKPLDASDISNAIDAARGILDASPDVRDALRLDADEIDELFTLEAEGEERPALPAKPAAPATPAGADEDPFSII